MNKKIFHLNTDFEDNTYYTFDKKSAHIYNSDTTLADKKKYCTICGGRDTTVLNTAFYLHDLKNITLDFDDAIITLHGKIQPFIIDNCENVTIKNIKIEYERAFYTELDVVSRTEEGLCAKAKEKFPCRIENGYFIPYAKEWENRNLHCDGCMFLQAFDSQTGDGKGLMVIYLGEEIVEQESPPCNRILHVRVRKEGDNIVFIGKFPENWTKGTTVVLEHESRAISGIAMYHSKNITLDNCRLINGGGMGYYAVYTENITLRSIGFFRDEISHGVITNSADGIHFVACKGKVEITDSIFEGMIDDALNIHANYYHVVKGDGNTIYARRSNFSHGLNAYAEVFGEGDVIAVYNGATLEEKCRFTIINAEVTGEWTTKFTVDKFSDFLCEDDLIENITTNPELIIRNSRFSKINSHVRLQTRGKTLLENCEFSLPVMLTGDMNYWFESSPINDLTIKDCRFLGKRGFIRLIPEFTPTDTAPYYHSGIKVENCSFEHNPVLIGNGGKDITFYNCAVLNGDKIETETHGCENIIIN